MEGRERERVLPYWEPKKGSTPKTRCPIANFELGGASKTTPETSTPGTLGSGYRKLGI